MKSRPELEKLMLTRLSKDLNIREASNIVAYYFDAKDEVNEQELKNDIDSIINGVPVQYVCKRAFFYGFKFIIDQKVLIPRPETEELVHWIISDHKRIYEPVNILDIGSGSGCIILSILKTMELSVGTALDIDPISIDLINRNADYLNTNVECLNLNILDESTWTSLNQYDVIACNPPYITADELDRMGESVKEHEPKNALFVTDGDPLQFYRSILSNGKNNLKDGGSLYFETSDIYHDELIELVESLSYHYEFRKDMQGKWRMLKAWKK